MLGCSQTWWRSQWWLKACLRNNLNVLLKRKTLPNHSNTTECAFYVSSFVNLQSSNLSLGILNTSLEFLFLWYFFPLLYPELKEKNLPQLTATEKGQCGENVTVWCLWLLDACAMLLERSNNPGKRLFGIMDLFVFMFGHQQTNVWSRVALGLFRVTVCRI